MNMAYNRQEFIQAARQDGFSDEVINAALEKRGHPTISPLERIGDVARSAGGWAGGAIGTPYMIGPATGIAGQMLGYGLEETLDRFSALQNYGSVKEAKKNVKGLPDVFLNAIYEESKKGFLKGSGLQTIYGIAHPLLSSGKMREKFIGKKELTTSRLEETYKDLQEMDEYKSAPADLQKTARKRLGDYIRAVAPYKTVGTGAGTTIRPPATIRINKLYRQLVPFERSVGAYEKSSLVPRGTELASRAVRQYLNTEIPTTARAMNRIYSGMKGLEPYVQSAKFSLSRSLPWLLGAGILGRMVKNTIEDAIGER